MKILGYTYTVVLYSGKVWRMESLTNHPLFAKLKPSNLVLTIDSLWADLVILQTFFHQMLEKSQFTKDFPRQTFFPPNFPAIRYTIFLTWMMVTIIVNNFTGMKIIVSHLLFSDQFSDMATYFLVCLTHFRSSNVRR